VSLLRFVPYVPPVLLIVTALVVNLSSHHAPAKTNAATSGRAHHTTPLVQVESARMKK